MRPGPKLVPVAIALLVVCSTVSVPVVALNDSGQTVESTGGQAPSAAGNGIERHEMPRNRATRNVVESGSDTGGSQQGDISPALQAKIGQATTTEKIPVIVVFDTRPRQQFEFQRVEEDEAKDKLTTLVRTEQANALEYLERQQARNRAGTMRMLWSTNSLAVRATPGTIQELSSLSEVEAIVYDREVKPSGREVRPFTEILSRYGNTTVPSGFDREITGERAWGVEYIGADAVQERGVTGEGINVSVVDTGIDDSHPALNGSIAAWKDFTADAYASPGDPDGHGTHVAGTIAGHPSGTRAVGVAPGANLFGAKVFSKNPSEHPTRISDLVEAFQWSADNGADVISASIGVPPVYEVDQGQAATGVDAVGTTTSEIHTDASALSSESSTAYEAYKPAYVMVIVEPTAVDGTQLDSNQRREAVMENLSVALRNPAGNNSLRGVDAGWAFEDGQVPDEIVYRKYKPSGSEPIHSNGTWTLEVTSTTGRNVSYEYTVSPVYPTNGSDSLAESVNTITRTHGVVSVIAAGNYGSLFGDRTVSSPGAAAEAITVGATGYRISGPAPFSSRGPIGYGTDQRAGIDLLAPGTDIVSAVPTTSTAGGQEPYGELSGTSMATPHVSGTVALLLDAEPSQSPDDVRYVLRETAQDVPVDSNAAGAGVLDAYRAVNETNSSAFGPAQPEAGRYALFGGIGNTESNEVGVRVDPYRDTTGDADTAPDIAVTSRVLAGGFEVGIANDTAPNATFRLYVDADRTDGSGDPAQAGAEYLVVINRTFDGSSYMLSAHALAYNSTADQYAPTEELRVSAGDAGARFVELDSFSFAARDDEKPVDWHLTSAAAGNAPGDRFPNSGQVSTVYHYELKGTAIAWNATDGGPATEIPVDFRVFSPNGRVVGTQTLRTNGDGRATPVFNLSVNTLNQAYAVEIADPYGNTIDQRVRFYSACIERCYSGATQSTYTVEQRRYEAERNSSLTINIPVYGDDGGEIQPYTGPASIRLRNVDTGTGHTIEDLRVDDGVIRSTIDFRSSNVNDAGTTVAIDVVLAEAFSGQSNAMAGGEISVAPSGVATHVAPHSTIVPSDGEATLSFQQETVRDGGPANASAQYVVYWVSDREVAALYEKLPTETTTRLKTQYLQAKSEPTQVEPITGSHKRALQQTLTTLKKQGTITRVTRGTAQPTARGVGDFELEPPVDARFGIVQGYVNGSQELGGVSTVFVEDEFRGYTDNQTEPAETTPYDLRLDASWDTQPDGPLAVPNDTATVRVSLLHTDSGAYADNATVKLYTTFGETRTVRTDGSGQVTVRLNTSDRDWRNLTYEQRRQEVLGVVVGEQTADGSPITATESLYGAVYERPQGVEARPDIQWKSDGVLNTTLAYRNATTDEPSTGTVTLVKLTSQRGSRTIRDIAVGYVNGTGESSVLVSSQDSLPPAADESRQYRVETRADPGADVTNGDQRTVNGLAVSVTAPATMTDDQTRTVSVRVTDRTGEPVQDGVVRWSYTLEHHSDTRTGESTIPEAHAGGTAIGTTNESGVATFEVAPEIAESVLSNTLRYQVGVVTANSSQPVAALGSIVVKQSNASVYGTFNHPDGSGATDDTVAVWGSGQGGTTQTNESGSFDLKVEGSSNYSVAYYQQAADGSYLPRDGRVDLYAAARVEVNSSSESIGTVQLPEGHVLDIQVVDADGDTVENASVTVAHQNHGVNASWRSKTDSDGYLNATATGATGIEVNGTISISVSPPGDASRFKHRSVSRTVEVINDTTVTIGLREKPAVTGKINYPNATTRTGDTLLSFEKDGSNEYTTATLTESDGSFRLPTTASSDVDVQFYQGNWVDGDASSKAPRDGVVDLYAVREVNTTDGPVSLGNVSVPSGAVLNVTVVNESGAPVEDASITVTHTNGNADASIRNMSTNAAGKLVVTENRSENGIGIEIHGNTSIAVRPPDNSWRFEDTTKYESVRVTNDTELTVTLPESERPTTPVLFDPREATATKNTTQRFEIAVGNATGGVGAFEGTVALRNESVGSITDVTVNGSARLSTVDIASDGSSAVVEGAVMDTENTGKVVIVTVTVTGTAEGQTDIEFNLEALGTEAGEPYNVTTIRNGTLTVEGIPQLRPEYEGPPTDIDNDGVFEDINGDGEFNIIDIQALYTLHDHDIVQANTDRFDVNGDGDVDIVDVQALYIEEEESK